MRRLPPFPELIAFEAVARHLSFTRAAAELHLTQSAVSHRVRKLEEQLCARLFQRLNPGLVLTERGRALLPELTDCLDRLARLGAQKQRRLRVAAGEALCSWWLVGRLPAFMAQRPDVSIELLPVNAESTLPRDIDVRILWVESGADEANAKQTPLFTEQVFPVCSPKLLPGGRPLRDAAALAKMTLLHKHSGSAGEWSWPIWWQRLGVDPARHRAQELHLAEMGLVLSAAIEGAGVALSRSLLVHDALRAGRLAFALEQFEPMLSSKRHVARWPTANVGDEDVAAFVRWLVDEAGKTIKDSAAMIEAMTAPPALESTQR